MVEETILARQHRLRSWKTAKSEGRRLAVLTTADYPTARLLDETGIDLLLVGDSLGMVTLGYPDTTHVTMEEMLHHLRAVVRGATRTPICADLPYASYRTPREAVENAGRLIEAGAHLVKMEGGTAIAAQLQAVAACGFPFIGHIGMLPQHIQETGRYRKFGRDKAEAARLTDDAHVLEDAGALGIVLECIMPTVASLITASIEIPTIGIGSGPECDGQVLVLHDLIGLFPWFRPSFAEPAADVATQIKQAATCFRARVDGDVAGTAPSPHSPPATP